MANPEGDDPDTLGEGDEGFEDGGEESGQADVETNEGGENTTSKSGFEYSGILDQAKAVLFGDVDDGVHKPSLINQLLLATIAILVIITVFNILRSIVNRIISYSRGTPWIVKGTKNAQHELVISQDPGVEASVPLRRSLNEEDGLEFSYMLWMFIDDWEYKKGQWKHVFHKGNESADPNRAPGVWLHPNENKMRVYMNTFQTISDFVDIDNIPVGKWFHVAITLKQQTMDIYINGFLKKRVVLDSIPRQNFGNLWVNTRGGFGGLVSRMRYFNYAARFTEIEYAIKIGPSRELPQTALQVPPYLAVNWHTT